MRLHLTGDPEIDRGLKATALYVALLASSYWDPGEPEGPIRATAYVGRPVPEIEAGDEDQP